VKLEYRGERVERGRRQRTVALSVALVLSGRAGGHHVEPPPIADSDAHEAHAADSAGVRRHD
jgi:hypothetical protein